MATGVDQLQAILHDLKAHTLVKLVYNSMSHTLHVCQANTCGHQPGSWQAMQSFTAQRNVHTTDELWLVHTRLHTRSEINWQTLICSPRRAISRLYRCAPRAEQVTGDGPGQLMIYTR